MNIVVIVFGFLILSAVSAEESLLDQFAARVKTVKEIDDAYQNYLRINKAQGKPNSTEALDKFIEEFEANFDNSDQWIADAMLTKNRSRSLVNATMKKNGYHLAETVGFIDSGLKLTLIAAQTNYQFQVHSNNVTVGAKIQSFMERVKREFSELKARTIEFLTKTAWRTQFRSDALDIISSNSGSSDLAQLVLDKLKEKYPFRSWMTVLHDSRKENTICLNSKAEVFKAAAGSNRQLIVTEVLKVKDAKAGKAASFLAKIPKSKNVWWHSCKDRPNEILNTEAGYTCSMEQFAFAGVFESEHNFPKFAVSEGSLLGTALVYRARMTFLCKAYYRVLFLG